MRRFRQPPSRFQLQDLATTHPPTPVWLQLSLSERSSSQTSVAHEQGVGKCKVLAGPGEARKTYPRPMLQMAVSAVVALALTASYASAVPHSRTRAHASAFAGAALGTEGREKVGEGQRLARGTNWLCAQDRTVYIRASRLANFPMLCFCTPAP